MQWHLKSTYTPTYPFNGTMDLNVEPAWESGYTGQGVKIAIVDDGLQRTHPDLSPNYDASISHNWNNGNPSDPSPDPQNGDFHGTSCAGAAAAANDGKICGVGVAYGATLAGLRLIADTVSDATEAAALNYKYQEIDIYSNSWGPPDDGARLEAPGRLLSISLENGVQNGRNGKGSIYIWAAGNGAMKGDNCNYDGYANSPFTISIGAITSDGLIPYYSEKCAALIGVAPSSGGKGIVTTDYTGTQGYSADDCNYSFGGTSAAAPQVAGVVALMLSARPELGWKDVQYILINSARVVDPNDGEWRKNGAGYMVSHKFGFGMIDAGEAVKLSKSWEVKGGGIHKIESPEINVNKKIPDFDSQSPESYITDSFVVSEDKEVEHVVITFTAEHPVGTDLEVVLESPSGTNSTLAELHGFTPSYVVKITSPTNLASTLQGNTALFGPDLNTLPNGISGEVILADPIDACQNITTNLSQKIALVSRGTCDFVTKVRNCQNAGAIGVIVKNDRDGSTVMGGTDNTITIPSLLIKKADGDKLVDFINSGQKLIVELRFWITKLPDQITYSGWKFTTSRNWGEKSVGLWKLHVADKWNDGTKKEDGVFKSWKIEIYYDGPRTHIDFGGSSPKYIQIIIIGAMILILFGASGFAIYKIRQRKSAQNNVYHPVDLGSSNNANVLNSFSINLEDTQPSDEENK
eukprot:TRINITY_DN3817_c0_g2_i2.p1 TRINITY_DN3817_c0_g2~~TRINITY_DN3817_c0_g2_i2.p1  ORF type:complete len:692 (-),score=201.94 TRINITY_DN3817_c0_g2_i2:56-2131(-)